MADAKLTALTAASALAAADLFYVSQSAASRKATGAQLLALVGTTYVPLAGNATMTGALTIASGTLTASAPALNITQTWNQGATVFTALKLNVTNTASNDNSMLCDLQLAGTSKFNVSRDGVVTTTNTILLQNILCSGSLYIPSDAAIRWSSTTSVNVANDLYLYRDAAATLAQRNGTTQQIFRLYNTYTDASNYERLTLTGVAGTSVNITAETLGTGADNLDIVLTPAGTGRLTTPAIFETSAIVAGILAGGATTINYYTGGVRAASTGEIAWTVGNANASVDTALFRNAAGIVEVTNGTAATFRDLKLRNLIQTEYHEVAEMTAPAAPATNSVRIYAEDNGAGKTRLMALFATGSAVQIAVEP